MFEIAFINFTRGPCRHRQTDRQRETLTHIHRSRTVTQAHREALYKYTQL